MTNNELIARARDNAKKAYCPYSHFHVGCAIELSDGTIIDGCNVENASYGLTICAERNALFQLALLRNPDITIKTIVISCPDLSEDAAAQYRMPCGACRQVMAELLERETSILIDGVGAFTINDLLPQAFKL